MNSVCEKTLPVTNAVTVKKREKHLKNFKEKLFFTNVRFFKTKSKQEELSWIKAEPGAKFTKQRLPKFSKRWLQ
jgi:hypothetical protein